MQEPYGELKGSYLKNKKFLINIKNNVLLHIYHTTQIMCKCLIIIVIIKITFYMVKQERR